MALVPLLVLESAPTTLPQKSTRPASPASTHSRRLGAAKKPDWSRRRGGVALVAGLIRFHEALEIRASATFLVDQAQYWKNCQKQPPYPA
ncbi:hypothetical protein [Mobiluncus mulieris]|uniref:hypothetical protein n=1 Tax=Mobiluncus mulieris TaxID=2052 RepID=UPI0020936651|nr:hypothetical protein [Mobiluncus mulieris]